MTSEIVPERNVERVFQFRCSCGETIVSNDRNFSCARCGKSHEVRRVREHKRSPVTVEYHFQCCFCNAPTVSNAKAITCSACGKPLKLLRNSNRSARRSYYPKHFLSEWCMGMVLVILMLAYLFDLASC
jgi:hypothetical protein